MKHVLEKPLSGAFLFYTFDEMNQEEFLLKEFPTLLRKLNGNEKGNWGVLSPIGMIEHMTDSVAVAWERIKQAPQFDAETTQKARNFALSEKPFKPGTKNQLMSDTPAPLRNNTVQEAVVELETELTNFYSYHNQNPGITVLNPFFGELNYQEWILLLNKHAKHHLKQFNLLPDEQ